MRYLLLALALLLVGLAFRRLGRRQEAQKRSHTQRWLAEAFAPSLSRLLHTSESSIRDLLLGTTDQPDLQRQILQSLPPIEIAYEQRSPSEIACSVHSRLSDGTLVSSQRLLSWDDLPDSVREAFLRSQDSSLSFSYSLFPEPPPKSLKDP